MDRPSSATALIDTALRQNLQNSVLRQGEESGERKTQPIIENVITIYYTPNRHQSSYISRRSKFYYFFSDF